MISTRRRLEGLLLRGFGSVRGGKDRTLAAITLWSVNGRLGVSLDELFSTILLFTFRTKVSEIREQLFG